MGYQAYPDYKEARLEWLGTLPKHWDCLRLRLLSKRYSGGTPDKKNDFYWLDGTIPWLNSGAVNQSVITQPSDFISELGLKESSAKWVPAGAVIIALAGQGKTKGTAAITELKTTCNQSMAAIVFESDHPKFMYWWLYSQYKNIRGMASDDGRDGLNLEMIGSIPCPRPSEGEQLKIAQFLDHKTAQIDRLIGKKRELVEKLQEQCIATTTQVVTKGVASGIALKASNNQWFDSIPIHWQVIRLKDLVVDAIAGPYGSSLTKSMYTNSGYRVYGQQQVIPENFAIGDYYISDEKYEEMQRYRTLPRDILISVMGTIGRAALVPDNAEPGIINPRLVLYRANKRIVRPEYLKNFINSQPSQNYFSLVAQGTTMEGINMALIGELAVAVPPLHEQDKILLAQQARTARLEKQAESVTNAIERLQEYRTALITAAVTGQIDVRDWQAPAAVEAPELDKEVA